MSLSDELRQAAAHIRAVAGETIPGPWRVSANGLNVESDMVTVMENFDEPLGPWHRALSPHIALWDPDVAELVAAWLDDAATDQDPAIEVWHRNAIQLARAINAKAATE